MAGVVGISANRLELLQIADAVAREKTIDRKIVIQAMEDAIQKAAKSRYGAENDIRCHVTKRKVSGGTWSEPGRDARDACLGLIKTCQKLGVSFFDYLGHRLAVPNAPLVPPLADLIRACPTR